MLTATAYDTHVEQLFERVHQLHSLMTAAGIPYRIVGGLAVFLHVSERDPIRARLTADVDAAILREHLAATIEAARKAGLVYRRVAGIDMLVDADQPKARSAVHLRFRDDEVCPAAYSDDSIPLAPVADLVGIKAHQLPLERPSVYPGSRFC